MHAIDIETQHVEEDEGTVEADSRFRDKVKVARVDDAIYCLFAIENQSTDDYSMPLRVMEYDAREYLRQIKESGDGKVEIKPVITIVMYWKPDKWQMPVNVKDMFNRDTVRWLYENGLDGYIQDYKMHLFEPVTANEKDLDKFRTELKDVVAYVKYSKSTDLLKSYNTKNNPYLSRNTVTLINELTNSAYEFDEGKERLNMCEAFEGIKEEGLKEGMEKGLKEGREEGLKKGKEDKYKSWVTAAGNLEKRGMNDAEIAAILGISESKLAEAFKYVEKLKSEKKTEKEIDKEADKLKN